MNNLIQKDSYRADVFQFDLEKHGDIFNLTISNAISWDWMKMTLTDNELKGLSNFFLSFVDKKSEVCS